MVQADQPPGNYWIRAETLESDADAQVPMDHVVKGILSYNGTDSGTLPTSTAHTAPVVMNCIDSGSLGSRCLPVTELRVHSSYTARYDALKADPDEAHEVSFQTAHDHGNAHFVSQGPSPLSPTCRRLTLLPPFSTSFAPPR